MTESLSRNLNCCVNGYPILLGKGLDVAALKSHGMEKAGFLARFLLRPSRDELLYWKKNCTLTYLTDKDNVISPVLDKKKEEKALFGTIAYLWYKKNKLSKMGFQIIQNASFVAVTLFDDLEKKVAESIGPLAKSPENLRVWEIQNQKLVLALPMNKQYGYIHLMYCE